MLYAYFIKLKLFIMNRWNILIYMVFLKVTVPVDDFVLNGKYMFIDLDNIRKIFYPNFEEKFNLIADEKSTHLYESCEYSNQTYEGTYQMSTKLRKISEHLIAYAINNNINIVYASVGNSLMFINYFIRFIKYSKIILEIDTNRALINTRIKERYELTGRDVPGKYIEDLINMKPYKYALSYLSFPLISGKFNNKAYSIEVIDDSIKQKENPIPANYTNIIAVRGNDKHQEKLLLPSEDSPPPPLPPADTMES